LDRARQLAERTVRGRYAPSPTGPQHLGNLRTALLAWLQARLAGGTVVLRMEDLDQPRVVPGSAEQICAELRWLGLDWDEGPDVGGPLGFFNDTATTEIYTQAFTRLLEQDLVYPCFCSRKDIQEAASAPHGPDGPVYPGTCREIPATDADLLARRKGRDPAWRLRSGDSEIVFDDELLGRRRISGKDVGDFVLKRRDGLYAYQLAVVVDDALMGITDVLRGADLIDSTPRQLKLYVALGLQPPRFWHVPLLTDDQGRRLAKRDDTVNVQAGDQTAVEVLTTLLSSLGFAEAETPRAAIQQLDPQRFRQQLVAISTG